MKRLVCFLAVSVLVLMPSLSYADYIGTGNLLLNSGAEGGMANWGQNGDISFVPSNNNIGSFPTSGINYFRTNSNGSGIYGNLYQFVNIVPEMVSDGNAYVSYGSDSFVFKRYGHGDAYVWLAFFDADNNVIKQFRPGIKETGSEPLGWWYRDYKFMSTETCYQIINRQYSNVTVPSNTTRIQLICSAFDGTNNPVTHGFDNLSLELFYVPEPSSMALLVLGSVVLRRKIFRAI